MDKYELIVSIKSTLLQHLLFLEGWTGYLFKYFGVSIKDTLYLSKFDKSRLYYSKDSIAIFVNTLKDHIQNDAAFGEKVYKDALKACNNLILTSQNISSNDVSVCSNKELVKKWQDYRKAFITWSPFLAIPNPYEKVVEDELKKEIFKKGVDTKLWQQLTSLPKRPGLVQEQLDLMQLAYEKRIGGQTDIKNHWYKYRWLGCYSPSENPLPKSFFQERLNDYLAFSKKKLAKKLFQRKARLNKDQKKYQNTILKLRISGINRKKLDLLRQLIFLKTYRMEAAMKSFYYTRPFFKELSIRFKISLNKLCRLTPIEIESFLLGPITLPQNLSLRHTQMVIKKGDKVIIYYGNKAKDYFKLTREDNDKKIKEIKGNPANGGRAVGLVRLINKNNLNQFKKGEILLAEMTTPDYLPVMVKAAAFITDYGGVTCHAAIVSREFGIPCIVGTQKATKVLKTGDRVEVDANKGLIRKLS